MPFRDLRRSAAPRIKEGPETSRQDALGLHENQYTSSNCSAWVWKLRCVAFSEVEGSFEVLRIIIYWHTVAERAHRVPEVIFEIRGLPEKAVPAEAECPAWRPLKVIVPPHEHIVPRRVWRDLS